MDSLLLFFFCWGIYWAKIGNMYKSLQIFILKDWICTNLIKSSFWRIGGMYKSYQIFILKDWWYVSNLHFLRVPFIMGNLPHLGCCSRNNRKWQWNTQPTHATRKSCSFLCFPGIWIRPRQQTNSDYSVDSDDLKKQKVAIVIIRRYIYMYIYCFFCSENIMYYPEDISFMIK